MAKKDYRKIGKRWLLALIVLLTGGYLLLLQAHVQAVSYFQESPASWRELKRSECLRWRRRLVFGDLRPGTKNQFRPLEATCEQALRYPRREFFVNNERGQKLRYLRYGPPANTGPILLYVHGIAANYVTGLKFYPIARRLGFELVVMELSNHGASDDDGRGAFYGCREDADLLAVLADLVRREPGREILIYGSSMGAMTIANAAPRLGAFGANLRAVVLENPQSSLRDILGVYARKLHVPDFHADLVVWLTGLRDGQDFSRCAPTERLAQLRYPAWVTISEKDFMVPVAMARKVFAHLPPGYPHVYGQYPHGDHSAIWNGQPERYEADLRRFWQSSLAFAAASVPSSGAKPSDKSRGNKKGL